MSPYICRRWAAQVARGVTTYQATTNEALQELSEVMDKDIQPSEVDTVRKAIENTRNAAMKIGQSMNNQSSSDSSSTTSENTENKENKEGEDKK